jgi:hypothetical protein
MAAASDISWSGPGGTFNLRAAAVICRGDDILLCTVDGLGYWFLPGGRVSFGEPALLRWPASWPRSSATSCA